MTAELMRAILQVVAGILLLITTGMAGWALKEVYALRADLENLKGRVEAESDGTLTRFEDIRQWMRDITKKLDRLIEKLAQE